MSEVEFWQNGDTAWRCTYCNRNYVSKQTADECCKGRFRMKQVRIDGKAYYYGLEQK